MRPLHVGEDVVVSLAFALMVLLPVSEVVLRFFFRGGIPSSVSVVQHLVLVVGMLGGALADRNDPPAPFTSIRGQKWATAGEFT